MTRSPRARIGIFVVVGLLLTVGIAFAVSPFASSEPDGLERVAADQGFDTTAEDHALADTPTADYAVDGVDNERVSTGAAGVIGVAATFAVGGGAFWLMRRMRSDEATTATEASPGAP